MNPTFRSLKPNFKKPPGFSLNCSEVKMNVQNLIFTSKFLKTSYLPKIRQNGPNPNLKKLIISQVWRDDSFLCTSSLSIDAPMLFTVYSALHPAIVFLHLLFFYMSLMLLSCFFSFSLLLQVNWHVFTCQHGDGTFKTSEICFLTLKKCI